MLNKKKIIKVDADQISKLLYSHFSNLMSQFYEMQSQFLTSRYKIHQSLESANIIVCFAKSAHLSIIRKREKHLDHDISLNNFLTNLNTLKNNDSVNHKIVSIVNATGIPKETVRRKVKKLLEKNFIGINQHKEYYWNLHDDRIDSFMKIVKSDIKALAKFISNICKFFNLNLTQKDVEKEIENQFSFYFYHFLSCELAWLKMWQKKIKDIDLILISLQTLIPTLKYHDGNQNLRKLGIENLYTVVGKTNNQYNTSNTSVSAASVSDITGIPRATCIRKLEKLVKYGMLVREEKTKRYYVNQSSNLSRSKHIITKENVSFTISIFCEFFSTVTNALINQKKNI